MDPIASPVDMQLRDMNMEHAEYVEDNEEEVNVIDLENQSSKNWIMVWYGYLVNLLMTLCNSDKFWRGLGAFVASTDNREVAGVVATYKLQLLRLEEQVGQLEEEKKVLKCKIVRLNDKVKSLEGKDEHLKSQVDQLKVQLECVNAALEEQQAVNAQQDKRGENTENRLMLLESRITAGTTTPKSSRITSGTRNPVSSRTRAIYGTTCITRRKNKDPSVTEICHGCHIGRACTGAREINQGEMPDGELARNLDAEFERLE